MCTIMERCRCPKDVLNIRQMYTCLQLLWSVIQCLPSEKDLNTAVICKFIWSSQEYFYLPTSTITITGTDDGEKATNRQSHSRRLFKVDQLSNDWPNKWGYQECWSKLGKAADLLKGSVQLFRRFNLFINLLFSYVVLWIISSPCIRFKNSKNVQKWSWTHFDNLM